VIVVQSSTPIEPEDLDPAHMSGDGVPSSPVARPGKLAMAKRRSMAGAGVVRGV
jgi:hypothetical protein